MEPDAYDVAGAATGVVEAANLLGPGRVRPGDVVVAMASSGLHSNGYSLVRHVLLQEAGWALDRDVPELGRTLGEELLEPTRIYARACLALAEETGVHAMAHVTGGGLAANLARVLPHEVAVTLDRSTWTPAPVFDVVRRVGELSQDDLEATLNCGVGMVALVPPDDVDRAIASLAERQVEAWVAGEGESRRRRRGSGADDRSAPRLVSPVRPVRDTSAQRSGVFCHGVCGNSHPLGSVGTTIMTEQTGASRCVLPRPRPRVRGGRPYGARPS